MNFNKIYRLILSLALVLTLTAACAKPQASDTESTQTFTPSPTSEANVTVDTSVLYSEAKLDIPFTAQALESPHLRPFFAYANGRVYYEASRDLCDDMGTVIAQQLEIHSVDTDGLNKRIEWSLEAPFDATTEMPEFSAIACFGVDDVDSLWVCIARAPEVSADAAPIARNFQLTKRAADGTQILTRELPTELELVRVRNMQFDGEGNVYLRAVSVDSDGSPEWVILVFSADNAEYLFASPSGPAVVTYAPAKDGRMLLRVANPEVAYSLVYLPFDVEARSMGQKLPHESYRNFLTMYRGDGEWDIYYGESNYLTTPATIPAIYGYSIATGTDAVVIDLAASEILVETATVGIYRISDTEFLLGKIGDGLYKLTHTPDKGNTNKIEITLGTVTTDANLTFAVAQFNRASDSIFVTIKDYGAETDVASAVVALDLDILNGKAPDIISLFNLSATKYTSKGVLTDLNTFLDNDVKLNRDDLFASVLALGETDGKLHHIIPRFIPTLIGGKASIFGTGGTTLTELNDVLKQYPSAVAAAEYSAADWVTAWTSYMLDDLVDWQSGTCAFDSPQFIELLNSAKRFPTEVDYTQFNADSELPLRYSEYLTKIRDNKILLNYSMLLDLRAVRSLREVFGDDGVYLGFPSSGGAGISVYADLDLSINAQSAQKDGAWKFISFLLGADFGATMPGFSINRDAFERVASAKTKPLGERDFSNGITLTHGAGLFAQYRTVRSADELSIDDKANYHLTDAEISVARDLIENVTTSLSGEATISVIVAEEVGAFINGIRTAEETARIIQSRVGLYVAEQVG